LHGQIIIPLAIILYFFIFSTWRPEPVPCNADEHRCPGDGTCIPVTKVCNFRTDCPLDNSDEADCPQIYTFEVRAVNVITALVKRLVLRVITRNLA
jgi:hypothetical protein